MEYTIYTTNANVTNKIIIKNITLAYDLKRVKNTKIHKFKSYSSLTQTQTHKPKSKKKKKKLRVYLVGGVEKLNDRK